MFFCEREGPTHKKCMACFPMGRGSRGHILVAAGSLVTNTTSQARDDPDRPWVLPDASGWER